MGEPYERARWAGFVAPVGDHKATASRVRETGGTLNGGEACCRCGCAEGSRSRPTAGCCRTRSSAAARAGSSSPTSRASGTGPCRARSWPSCCGRDRLPGLVVGVAERGDLPAAPPASPRPGLDGPAVLASVAGSYQLRPPGRERASTSRSWSPPSTRRRRRRPTAGRRARGARAAAVAEAIAARGFLTDDCEWVDRQRAVVRDLRVRAALAPSARPPARRAHGTGDRRGSARALDLDDARGGGLPPADAGAGGRGRAGRGAAGLGALPDRRSSRSSASTRRPRPRRCTSRSSDAAPPPRRRPTALPSGVVTFLLTDIVESSALWDDAPDGDGAGARAPRRHRRRGRRRPRRHAAEVEARRRRHGVGVRAGDRRRGRGPGAARRARRRAVAGRRRAAAAHGDAHRRGVRAGRRLLRPRPEPGRPPARRSPAPTRCCCRRPSPSWSATTCPTTSPCATSATASLRGLSRGENVFELARVAARMPSADARPATPPTSARPPAPGRARRRRARSSAAATSSRSSPACGSGPRRASRRPCSSAASPASASRGWPAELAARGPRATVALVLYGRCDEDLAAPLQPFIEALRVLAPGARGRRGCGRCAASTSWREWCPSSPSCCRRDAGRAGRSRHRAARALRRGHEAARAPASADAPVAARARRPALGRQDDAVAAAPRAARRQGRAAARGRHLPRHRARPHAPARGDARRPPPRRRHADRVSLGGLGGRRRRRLPRRGRQHRPRPRAGARRGHRPATRSS